jgi:hypothetical protein
VRKDKTKGSVLDNLLYFFSAESRDRQKNNPSDPEVVQGENVEADRGLPEDRRRVPEAVHDYPTQSSVDARPKKKQPRVYLERQYLEKPQTTRTGRETKRVQPFDPSAYRS